MSDTGPVEDDESVLPHDRLIRNGEPEEPRRFDRNDNDNDNG